MNNIGSGIGIAGLALAAAYLEVHGKTAFGLWVIILFWALKMHE